MTSKSIHFLPLDRHCLVANEESVLAVALNNGIEISHSCGGMGSCTTCRVLVEHCSQALPPRNELESDIADMRGFAENERLSCQLPALDGLRVRIPETLDSGLERT